MLGLFGCTVTNVWHKELALEPPPHSVVNTLGLTPCLLYFDIAVTLMTNELLRPLLDELVLHQGPDCHLETVRQSN